MDKLAKLSTSATAHLFTPAGGGEEGPTALVTIDFKNWENTRWGGDSHTLGETIEQDTSGELNPWDDTKVAAGIGLRLTGTSTLQLSGVLTSGAADALLPVGDGIVIVATVVASGTANTSEAASIWITDLPLTAEEWVLLLSHDVGGMSAQLRDDNLVAEVLTVGVGPTWKVAGRFTPSAFTGSADGNTTETASGDPSNNASATNVYLDMLIMSDDVDTATIIIERVDFYSADDVDAADLPALSTL